jgi:hypothetical protein
MWGVAVTVDRWRRYGKDRLYVNDGGVRLGWHDLITGTTVVEVTQRAADVHAAVAGLIPQPRAAADTEPPPSEAPAAAPATAAVPAPDQEASGSLAEQRAGQLARQRADQEWEAAKQRSKIRAYAGRMLGARTDERAWRLGAQGEETVGRALDRLPDGLHVLHSVPVGQRGSDIDHVVIGPPGVFTINTKHHPDKRVSVYPKRPRGRGVDEQQCS